MSVDFDEYEKLESENVAVVTRQDLPDEFGDKAYEVIVEFIRKTRNLDYEWAIFFDYVTGEILRCVKGERDNVNVDFKEVEFEDYHVASIHNHPEDVYSPPSDRNFGILMREFEDYELIASVNELLILKAKGVYENLMFEIKFISSLLFRAAFDDSKLKYDDWDEINDKCDESYGNQLSKYINDKNIRDILNKKGVYCHGC